MADTRSGSDKIVSEHYDKLVQILGGSASTVNNGFFHLELMLTYLVKNKNHHQVKVQLCQQLLHRRHHHQC